MAGRLARGWPRMPISPDAFIVSVTSVPDSRWSTKDVESVAVQGRREAGRLHADRAAGRHRDHRRADRACSCPPSRRPARRPAASSASTTSSSSAWPRTTTTTPTARSPGRLDATARRVFPTPPGSTAASWGSCPTSSRARSTPPATRTSGTPTPRTYGPGAPGLHALVPERPRGGQDPPRPDLRLRRRPQQLSRDLRALGQSPRGTNSSGSSFVSDPNWPAMRPTPWASST